VSPPFRPLFLTATLAAAIALAPAPAGGQDGDDAAAIEGPAAPPARAAGKPVPFERAWLEPFFKSGPARQAVEKYRADDWSAAEAGFSRALRALPRRGDERLAATYLLALTRASDSNWSEAGKLFEELYESYPRLGPYHAYNAARCRLRRGDNAGALEWAAKVARGSVPEAETELVRIDAFRALARWDDALGAIDGYLARFPNGPRHAEALFKKAEALEKAQPRGAADARPVSPDVTAIYRRVWAEAPLEAWGDRAGERLGQIAAALPIGEAAVIHTRTAGELCSRGNIFFDRNRNQEAETTFAAALGAPGLDADLECKARFFRAQSVWKERQRPRAAPLFDEADGACARAALIAS